MESLAHTSELIQLLFRLHLRLVHGCVRGPTLSFAEDGIEWVVVPER